MVNYFYDYNEKPINFEGMYKNQSVFLIFGGPSTKELDLEKLRQPGIITFGANNSPSIFRPNLWASVDSPSNFIISIWRDPRIMKFVMHGKRDKTLWDNIAWKESKIRVNECPNMWYFKDNEYFQPDKYLAEDTINWGGHTDRCECGYFWKKKDDAEKKPKNCPECGERKWGARSIMLAIIKMAYVLGFRKMFLLGCDFSMSDKVHYAWEQYRNSSSVKNNQGTYKRLNERFDRLRPILEKNGCYVFNCNPDSGLNSFPKIDFEDAIDIALDGFPETKGERTFGMYDRNGVYEKVEKERKYVESIENEIEKLNGSDPKKLERWKKRLERTKAHLKAAYQQKEAIEAYAVK